MSNVHSIQSFRQLPQTGTPGDAYLCREGGVYLVLPDGSLCQFDKLLVMEYGSVQGERGERGQPGIGLPGRNGTDGADGATGPQGPPGDLTIVGDEELQAAVTALKAEKAAMIASILARIDETSNLSGGPLLRAHLTALLAELQG